MQARLSAVQQVLVLLPVASLAFALVARPHLDNRHFADALDELSRFRAGFNRAALERSLQDHAAAQGTQPLSGLRDTLREKRGPKLQIASPAASVRPLTTVRLATLSDLRARTQPPTTLTIGVPDLDALGAALSWRLTRLPAGAPVSLTGVELATASVGAEDAARELEIAELRHAVVAAQAAVNAATARLEAEERVFEARRKRHMPWKVIVKSIEARNAARATLDEKTKALSEVNARYEGLAAEAGRTKTPTSTAAVPEVALARVTLTQGETQSRLDIPLRLQLREVAVPPLRAADFPATQAAGLWDDVKDLDVDAAIAAIRARFNWHNRDVEISGVKLSGLTVLQLLPCLLPLLLAWLVSRIRSAGTSYSPFTTKVEGSLPKVGLKNRVLDGLVLMFLPLVSAASAAVSLLLLGRLPVFPLLAAALCLVLGGYALVKLGELQELVASVVHSHSYPPPESKD